MSNPQEKIDEIAQTLLKLRAKRPDIYRQIMALIKALLGQYE